MQTVEFEITDEVGVETKKAILVTIEDKDVWVPSVRLTRILKFGEKGRGEH